MNKKYSITFTEGKTRNPLTRTLVVESPNEWSAGNIIINQFGSFNRMGLPSEKIKINEIKLIEENEEKDLTIEK